MRFRAEQRLRRQSDFRDAREKGRRHDCGGFMLWYHRRSAGMEGGEISEKASPKSLRPRVGVVASTSAVGCAVERNRAKRRLREVFRRNQHRVAPEYDLLLIARRSLNQLEYREIEQKFVEACRRIFPTVS